MKSETVFKRDIKWTFIYPFFTAETKKEERAARRMNEFFSRMEKLILQYSLSEGFPEGGKFTAECCFDNDISTTSCRLILKKRGRIVMRKLISYKWQNGYIKESNIM